MESTSTVRNFSADSSQATKDKIRFLRVIATLVVVLGHTIIIYTPSWSNIYGYSPAYSAPCLESLKTAINSFQMELFFSISGFCLLFTLHKNTPLHILIHNKFKRLLIPYFSVYLLWMVPIKKIAHYQSYYDLNLLTLVKNALLVNDCGHLWFLPVLFIILTISLLNIKLLRFNKLLPLAVSLLLLLLSNKANSYIISQSLYYIFFFTFGFYIHLYQLMSTGIKTKVMILSIGVLILLGLYYLHIVTSCYNKAYQATLAIFICTVFYLLSKGFSNSLTNFIDKHSFGIYLFHSPLLYIGMYYLSSLHPIIYVPLQFAIALSGSISVSLIIIKCKLNFLIGNTNGR